MPATRCARGPSLGAATLAEGTDQKRRFWARQPGPRRSGNVGLQIAQAREPHTPELRGAPERRSSDRHRRPTGPSKLTHRQPRKSAGTAGSADLRSAQRPAGGAAAPTAYRQDGSFLGAYPGGQGGAQAREPRTPEQRGARRSAGLRPASTAERRSKPRAAVCSHGTQARERRPPVGTAARRAAAAPTPTVRMAPSRRVPRRTGSRAGPGTAYPRTAWSARRSAGLRPAATADGITERRPN